MNLRSPVAMFVVWITVRIFTVTVKGFIYKIHFAIAIANIPWTVSMYISIVFRMVFVNFTVGTGIFRSVFNGSGSCKTTSCNEIIEFFQALLLKFSTQTFSRPVSVAFVVLVFKVSCSFSSLYETVVILRVVE